jgi:hypothetical protein
MGHYLLKMWCLTRREKLLICEAIIFLFFSTLCIRMIAFKRIERFLRVRWKHVVQSCDKDVRLVNRSVSRAANLLPWKSLCLSRSIAEFIMLRRRGIPAVLVAGVKFSKDRSYLDAHAWVATSLADTVSLNFVVVFRIGQE